MTMTEDEAAVARRAAHHPLALLAADQGQPDADGLRYVVPPPAGGFRGCQRAFVGCAREYW
ncbi:hypothetical protein [Kitasatospora sp. NPDC098663]|uniref:hypothetical protein n=1 Tax=Kitasatospora sp. NPDC098663 TaxID=3364096 RepID=UPI0038033B72